MCIFSGNKVVVVTLLSGIRRKEAPDNSGEQFGTSLIVLIHFDVKILIELNNFCLALGKPQGEIRLIFCPPSFCYIPVQLVPKCKHLKGLKLLKCWNFISSASVQSKRCNAKMSMAF